LVEEQTGDDGYLKDFLNDKDKVDLKQVAVRLKALKKSDADSEEWRVLNEYKELSETLKKQSAIVKELNAALDAALKEKYPAMTDAEVKELLVNRKWYYSIFDGIKALYVTASHSMANRITQLAERYENTLPQLEQETAACVFSVRDACSPWAEEIIEGAVSAGLVPKSNQQNFSKAISRRNAAQMFVSLLEAASGTDIQMVLRIHNVTMDMNAFSDTKDTAVLACNALGILKGTAPGVFSPDSTLTRAQAAAILNRAARILGVETSGYTHSFADVAGHWVSPELGWPAHVEILKGTGGGRFSPETQLTNEQAIAIVWRAWHVLGAA
jgi:hypothetical protein